MSRPASGHPFRLASFLLLAVNLVAAGPVVSNIRADFLSHSAIRLLWDNSAIPTAARVRFGFTTAYEDGAGGGIFVPGTSASSFFQYGLTVSISGLAPGATYHFCPQSSTDGGITWSDCRDFPLGLPAAPQQHPAAPMPPVQVDVTYPTQTGTVRDVAADCSDLQATIDAAQYGDTILIPAGTVCTGSYKLPDAPEAKSWQARNIQSSTATIALPDHGFSDGQRVRVEADEFSTDALPGSAGPDTWVMLRGILHGTDYYVKVVDGDHFQLSKSPGGTALDFSLSSFTADPTTQMFSIPPVSPLPTTSLPSDGTILQVKSTGKLPAGLISDADYCVHNPELSTSFQLRTGDCNGPAVVITDAGSGIHSFIDRGRGTGHIMAWPPENKWIIVRTSTPDEQFCAVGIRCLGSIWHSRMATLLVPTPLSPKSLITGILTHNWRFAGIEFTHGDASALARTSTDPAPFQSLLATNASNGFITLDRCYIHGLGFPNRLYRAIEAFDGDNMALINSDLDRLDFWHPYRDGVQPSMKDHTTVQISSGVYHMGVANATLTSPVSISIGGAGSGTGIAYFDLSGALRVILPPGVSGTCSGYSPCSLGNAATPAFPVDVNGRTGAAEIATFTITSGTVSAVASTGEPSASDAEGAQSFIAGYGPGPFLIENNRISGTGIPMHFDDSGAGAFLPHDYTIRRNLFTAPLSQLAGSAQSDGLRYYHRNHLEWKNGARILVEGNIFENNFGDVTPTGAALVVVTRAGGFTSDVKITSNTFQNSAGGLYVGPVDSNDPVSPPIARVEISNNILTGINGYLAVAPAGLQGFGIAIGYALEDVVLDHNAVYNITGWNPAFLFTGANRMEGVSVSDNLFWVNNDSGRYGLTSDNPQGCSGSGRNLMDCVWVSGVGNPSYQFSNNILVAGWGDSRNSLNPVDPEGLAADYSGLNVIVVNGSLPGAVQMAQVSGKQGPDSAVLAQTQGQIGPPSAVNANQFSVEIAFSAPDPGKACYVMYGTGNDIVDFRRTLADTSNTSQRAIPINSLLPGLTYNYSVFCDGASNEPAGTFVTRLDTRQRTL